MVNIRTGLAWLLAGAAILAGIVSFSYELRLIDEVDFSFSMLGTGWTLLIPGSFGILGAWIISHQERNIVGWLMLMTALAGGNALSPFLARLPVQDLTPGLWLLLWFDGWSWILFIFPVFLIPLFFPDGKLPSPRWKWVPRLALGMWLFLAVVMAFGENWPVPNPFGFIPQSFFGETFMVFWGIGLMTLVGGSVASLFVRYRHAGQVTRDQIKWILFAAVFFFFGYGFTLFTIEIASVSEWGGVLLMIVLLVFPIAIAIAILRHRLYDINLIIRRTLQYTIMTVLLAVVYFGGVVILQGVFGGLAGAADSPLVTVITTLGVAALFTPLRRRVQGFIDRRFYRNRVDSEQALARFSTVARDVVDLDRLMEAVFGVVEETLRPAKVSSWLKEPDRKTLEKPR
ncbi:MAG TPA: hypothetical protein VMN57_11280 [Anaerolineales bacterium]|nr:hypothetical protein [Anaerolineales bacterium]